VSGAHPHPHGVRVWLLAMRLPTLTASVAPVVVGSALAMRDGRFALGREGGHTRRRVLHHRDTTGREIERALLARVYRRAPNSRRGPQNRKEVEGERALRCPPWRHAPARCHPRKRRPAVIPTRSLERPTSVGSSIGSASDGRP